jgi:peroxiredoxin
MLLSTPAYDPNFVAPDFSLTDVVSGQTVSLYDQDLTQGFVVAFICNHCPYVQAIIEQFSADATELQSMDIPVFAVMSNNYAFVTGDSPEHMKTFATEHDFTFPYLVDEDQSVAKAYDAICTPDIFGFNADKCMQYRGHADGLKAAMMQIKDTGVGPSDYRASSGCSIKWK